MTSRARTWRSMPVRHPWWTALLAVLSAVALIAAAGGFRDAEPSYPPFQLGEPVELGSFEVTVLQGRFTTRDHEGEPLKNGARQIVLEIEALNLTDETQSFPSGMVRTQMQGGADLKNSVGSDTARSYQPGVREPGTLRFDVPAAIAGSEVRVGLSRQVFEWSNMINPGPAWGGEIPVAEHSEEFPEGTQ